MLDVIPRTPSPLSSCNLRSDSCARPLSGESRNACALRHTLPQSFWIPLSDASPRLGMTPVYGLSNQEKHARSRACAPDGKWYLGSEDPPAQDACRATLDLQ